MVAASLSNWPSALFLRCIYNLFIEFLFFKSAIAKLYYLLTTYTVNTNILKIIACSILIVRAGNKGKNLSPPERSGSVLRAHSTLYRRSTDDMIESEEEIEA